MITKENVKDIYALSPMQEGMLFHALLNSDSEAYFEQMEYRIIGTLDLELFEKSWNEVIQRHDILRTAFVHNKTERPIQIVLRERPIQIPVQQLMGLDELEQHSLIERYKTEDRQKGFRLDSDQLIRIAVFQTQADVYRIVWSHHHILLDGWSTVKIKSDFLDIYKALSGNLPLNLSPIRPYGHYIQWIAGQDKNASYSYWKNRLMNYEVQAGIPFKKRVKGNITLFEDFVFFFSAEETKRIQEAAVACNVTLNTFVQAVWGLLLGFYNDTTDVVFGTTVSGRPASLEGVEQMVGLFINTIPVRIDRSEEKTFQSLARKVQELHISSESHHYVSLSEIQSETALKNQLFDHIVVFENYPVGEAMEASGEASENGFRIEAGGNHETTNYDFNLIILPGNQLKIKFIYNQAVFVQKQIESIEGHFKNLVSQVVANTEMPLHELAYLPASEEMLICQQFVKSPLKPVFDNNTHTILDLIQKQTVHSPDAAAVSYNDVTLTYAELESASNRVANYLLSAFDLKNGGQIGVMMHRSEKLLITLLGILKAGGTYVSLDPSYPKDRLEYILSVAGCKTVFYEEEQTNISLSGHYCPFTDYAQTSSASTDSVDLTIDPETLVYLLFTSGSTGVPKGVPISHKNVLACTEGLNQVVYDYDTVLATTSINFDVSVSELLIPLTMGKKVRMLNTPSELPEWIEREKRLFVMTVPSVMEALLKAEINYDTVSCLGLAGEAFPKKMALELRESTIGKVFNLYGPTEDTIYSTYFDLDELHEDVSGVSIGRPILHTDVYILSKGYKILPVGVAGELFLAGEKLSSGYWNQQSETEKRFLPHPFEKGKTLYRTGDLVRWLEDGTIEFLGRIDQQIKLNGFRIELEEIEFILNSQPGITGAKIVAQETDSGGKKIVGYYTGNPFLTADLMETLAQKLPYYMLPETIIHLDEFPLSPNGKIDIKQLPTAGNNGLEKEHTEAPTNDTEQLLVSIWKQVLGKEHVGVNDNYYHLGGDSIKAIQIIAALYKQKFTAHVRDLFEYKTIKSWAPYVQHQEQIADQQLVTGEIPLSPIQSWFFETVHTQRNHFNQSTLVKATQRLDHSVVSEVIRELALHHDALRMQFRMENNRIVQFNAGKELAPTCEFVDLSNQKDENAALTEHATRVQTSLNPETGPLVKAVVYRLTDADRLFLCIHHLVVDGVSWRILQKDFESLYTARISGKKSELGYKTESFQAWVKALHHFADSPEMNRERTYWESVVKGEAASLRNETPVVPVKNGDRITCSRLINSSLTEQLTGEANKAWHTEINDLLLAALSETLSAYTGKTTHRITLEGHGREPFGEGINISRTIGWFTTMYPVLLHKETNVSLEKSIVSTKEMLRKIPKKGLGYGCLRYLSTEDIALDYQSDILFNYLGDFGTADSSGLFEPATESTGPDFSPEGEVTHPLTINSSVQNGELKIDFIFSEKHFPASEMQQLLEQYTSQIERIVELSVHRTVAEKTPSDFLFNEFSVDELELFLSENNLKNSEIEDLYPLAQLQEGLFFHALYNPESQAYHEQMTFTIDGSLDEEIFRTGWNLILERHDVLRTVFTSKAASGPLQVVLKKATIEFTSEDWSTFSETVIGERLRAFQSAEKARPFELDKGKLMRVALLKTGNNSWEVVWSSHHILMDGWCLGIVQREFLEIYKALKEHQTPQLAAPVPYRNYLKWLSGQNQTAYSDYWKSYLKEYGNLTGIPKDAGSHEGILKEHVIRLNADVTSRLEQLTAQHEVTMSSLVQTAWGLLLSRYNQTEDIIFGATVSGRPGVLESVSEIVGLFINTIPVRIQLDPKTPFMDAVRNTNQKGIESKENSYYSLAKIQSDSKLHEQLFDHVLVYENYPVDKEIERIAKDATLGFSIGNIRTSGQTNYDFSIAVNPGLELQFDFAYNDGIYSTEQVLRFGGHLLNVLTIIANQPQIALSEISILSEDERQFIAAENVLLFGETAGKSIIDLFREQVVSHPETIAVISGEETITYRELDLRSNRIANWLRSEKGMSEGDLIGVLTDLSDKPISAFLGILKIGATYLPLAADGPIGRNKTIVEHSDCKLLLSNGSIGFSDTFPIEIADLNKSDDSSASETGYSNAHHTPYIIFTSGTTGIPKGVEIEQSGIVNNVFAMAEILKLDRNDRLLQFFPYTFDVSHYQVYQVLLTGAALVLVDQEKRNAPETFTEYLNAKGVTIAGLPPAYFVTLPLQHLTSVKTIYTGGEPPSEDFINVLLEKGIRYLNLYGLTETSCNSLYYEVTQPLAKGAPIPIGKAIANTAVTVRTTSGQLQPIGAIGEICIEGEGLAKGYYNDAELTNARFIGHPDKKDKRLFLTGDLGKYDANGNILFAGRKDDQVTLRGHRIEIGEIERCFTNHEKIDQAKVILFETENDKHLVAYFTSEEEINDEDLRDYLKEQLPSASIPSQWMRLAALPLTAHGKVDKKALPVPDFSVSNNQHNYLAPATHNEQILVEIWERVLGVSGIGTKDNFFDLGGDSIKAIQIVSRLGQHKLKIVVKDVFDTSNIRELAKRIHENDRQIDQHTVTGNVPLTPIQHWFFETFEGHTNHFNQSMLLEAETRLNVAYLAEVLNAVQVHHDALRATVHQTEQQFRPDMPAVVETIDLSRETNPETVMELHAEQLQSGLNLETGPLVKMMLFRFPEKDRLLIVIHHLVIDGISWRILLEDFQTAYTQLVHGEKIVLPLKTNSYQQWAHLLQEYSQSPKLLAEKPYWEKVEQQVKTAVPIVPSEVSNTFGEIEYKSLDVSEEITQRLLKSSNAAFKTEINDLLLLALTQSIGTITGEAKLALSLEGHGRETLHQPIDVSRTIGWFTSIFPLCIDLKDISGLPDQIKTVKETIRAVPNKGIGYGVLKYLSGDCELTARPQVSFNYLGELSVGDEAGTLRMIDGKTGNPVHPEARLDNELLINAIVTNGKLSVSCGFNPVKLNPAKIEQLLAAFEAKLTEIVEYCSSGIATELTPSDFQYKELSLFDYTGLLRQYNWNPQEIVNIYTLSPLQKGMLFHALRKDAPTAYFQQMCYQINGTLNTAAFMGAWTHLSAKYAILRTAFVETPDAVPVQVVFKTPGISNTFRSLKELNPEEQQQELTRFTQTDLQTPFDLSSGKLMRVHLFELAENQYQVVWSYHHILMDGWCQGIIQKDFFEAYHQLLAGDSELTGESTPYVRYIGWLGQQDQESGITYWQNYLQDITEPTVIPKKSSHSGTVRKKSASRKLETSFQQQLTEFVKQQKCTLNTVIQTAWGILLSHYNSANKAVFGAIVSGRPSEIEGVEEMIGLFINTVPVKIAFEQSTTVTDLIQKTQTNSLESDNYHHMSLAEIQANTFLKQELLDHIMIFENYPIDRELEKSMANGNSGFSISNVEIHEQTTYDLVVLIVPGETLGITIEYNAAVYESAMIEQVLGQFIQLLENMMASPAKPVSKLELLSAAEKQRLLHDFGTHIAEVQRTGSIPVVFEKVAHDFPERPAVKYGKNELSYAELNEQSDAIASSLLSRFDLQEGDIVGILLPQGLEVISSILGILKAGCAYLPIDPAYPEERTRFILNDSGAKVVITESELDFISTFSSDTTASVPGKPVRKIPENALAYVIYTSGSTGLPKGVRIHHHSVLNLVDGLTSEIYNLYPEELNVALVASTVFDASVQQLFGCLLNGHCLHLTDSSIKQDDLLFSAFIHENRIHLMDATPSLLNLLLQGDFGNEKPAALRHIVIGGEALPSDLIRAFYQRNTKNIRFTNVYGPTECTVDASYYHIDSETTFNQVTVKIGKPLPNYELYVLNSHQQPVPIGVAGEICIAGKGVSSGYLNRDELTARQFTDHAFRDGAKMYRTGDIGQWDFDGNLSFIRRNDSQVKVRGHRIELGEIEALLRKLPQITAASALLQEIQGSSEIVVYYCSESIQDEQTLKAQLRKHLPEYAIPRFMLQVKTIPLTTNGKVDREALVKTTVLRTQNDLVAPNTETEYLLSTIWKDLLRLDQISTEANFFELGGHSLLVMQLRSTIAKKTGKSIRIADVFNHPTIKQLAALISHESTDSGEHRMIRLNQHQADNPILFFLPPVAGTSLFYQPLAQQLQEDYNCFGIQMRGLEEGEIPYESIEEIADDFLHLIQQQQTSGTYLLFGYSMGVNIALEICRQLENAGKTCSLILADGNTDRMEEELLHVDFSKMAGTEQWEKAFNLFLESMEEEGQKRMEKLINNNLRLMSAYHFNAVLKADVYCLEARDSIPSTQMESLEGYTTGLFEHELVPGDHYGMFGKEHLEQLAGLIRQKTAVL